MLIIIVLKNNNMMIIIVLKITLIKLNYPVFTPDLQLVPKTFDITMELNLILCLLVHTVESSFNVLRTNTEPNCEY